MISAISSLGIVFPRETSRQYSLGAEEGGAGQCSADTEGEEAIVNSQVSTVPAEPTPEPIPGMEPNTLIRDTIPDMATRFERLPRFGRRLFDKALEWPRPTTGPQEIPYSTPVGPGYILGPGDALVIRCWRGPRENINQTVTVTTEGSTYLPLLGERPVAGETLGSIIEAITREYTRLYTDAEVSVVLAQTRHVQVYVVGEVQHPGTYMLPGNATAFTALQIAGGPSDIGSLRQIRLLRRPPTSKPNLPQTIDLYDYLLQGLPTAEISLRAGDSVFVPAIGPEVSIAGEVLRPARYELRTGEGLRELINMCGGLQPTADLTTVHIWRNTPHGRRLLSIDLTTTDGTPTPVELLSGDLVEVLPSPDTPIDVVEISGAVKRPGSYSYIGGQRTSDLIAKAGGLQDTAYTKRGKLLRRDEQLYYRVIYFAVGAALTRDNTEDLPLEPHDKVIIYTRAEMEPPAQVAIRGPVPRPGYYQWAEGMKMSDLLLQAGGLLEEACGSEARILRQGPGNKQHLISVPLHKAIEPSGEADMVLERGDILEILVAKEVTTPSEVRISGYVEKPGTYKRYEGMQVSDLILMAGGLAPGSGPTLQCIRGRAEDKVDIIDLSLEKEAGEEQFSIVPNLILKDDDHITALGLGKFVRYPPVVIVEGEVKQPGAYPLRGPGVTLWEVLQEAGGLLERANHRGIIVYRSQNKFFSASQKYQAITELQQVMDAFNRERREQILERGKRGALVEDRISKALSNIFTSESGTIVVVPPRLLSESVWAEAIPIAGDRLFASGGREEDMELMDGDYIVVPPRTNTIGVVGAVVRSGAIPYEGRYSPQRYVELAGGVAEDANLARMVVIRANTRVVPAKLAREVYPGDVIVVPSDFLIRTVSSGSDYGRIIQNLAALAAAILIF